MLKDKICINGRLIEEYGCGNRTLVFIDGIETNKTFEEACGDMRKTLAEERYGKDADKQT